MKYPVLLKLTSKKTIIHCATSIHSFYYNVYGNGETKIYFTNGDSDNCVDSIEEIYIKIKNALNPDSNIEALKHQNSQLIQELESTKAKLEAYKGEIEDIRDLVGANDDESAFDEVQRLHNKNISTYIAFAGFFEKTIDLIPNDLVVEVQKILNELKP